MKAKSSPKGSFRPVVAHLGEAPSFLKKRVPGIKSQSGPIVGFTSQIIRTSKWYKEISQTGLQAVEINRRHSKLHFNLHFLEKVKKYLEGYETSLHSATNGIFQDLEDFTEAELAVLKAEVETARFLGAGEIVFHLNDRWSEGGQRDRLRKIIDQAKERGVAMLYESDSGVRAEDAYEVLEAFPDIGYVLDLGHLNLGIEKNLLGCPLFEFLDRIAPRTVYIHASNNNGRMDQHLGLNQGCLDWTGVMDRLDREKIKKIIIEVRSFEYLAETIITLENYLETRAGAASEQEKGRSPVMNLVAAGD